MRSPTGSLHASTAGSTARGASRSTATRPSTPRPALVHELAYAFVDRELDSHARQAAGRAGSWRPSLSGPIGATER